MTTISDLGLANETCDDVKLVWWEPNTLTIPLRVKGKNQNQTTPVRAVIMEEIIDFPCESEI